jgi:hypothetical protein
MTSLADARAARRGSARRGECFWARSAVEREAAAVAAAGGEKALSEQRGSITQGLGVHTRVLSSNRSATRTATRALYL